MKTVRTEGLTSHTAPPRPRKIDATVFAVVVSFR